MTLNINFPKLLFMKYLDTSGNNWQKWGILDCHLISAWGKEKYEKKI